MTLGQSCRSLGTSTKHVNLAVFLNGEGPETSNNNVTSLKKLYLKCRVQKNENLEGVWRKFPYSFVFLFGCSFDFEVSETILVSTGGTGSTITNVLYRSDDTKRVTKGFFEWRRFANYTNNNYKWCIKTIYFNSQENVSPENPNSPTQKNMLYRHIHGIRHQALLGLETHLPECQPGTEIPLRVPPGEESS